MSSLRWPILGLFFAGNVLAAIWFARRAPVYEASMVVRAGHIDPTLLSTPPEVLVSRLPEPFNDPPVGRMAAAIPLPPVSFASTADKGGPTIRRVEAMSKGRVLRITAAAGAPAAAAAHLRDLAERVRKSFGDSLDAARRVGEEQIALLEKIPGPQFALTRKSLEAAMSRERSFNYELLHLDVATEAVNAVRPKDWALVEIALACFALALVYASPKRVR